MSWWCSELWINTDTFFERMRLALYPNTNSMESMTLDLPLPLGPTIEVKHYVQGGREGGRKRGRGREEDKGEEGRGREGEGEGREKDREREKEGEEEG